jgi:hypothetical protein
MYTKKIRFMRHAIILACDGKCSKAWGLTSRPKEQFDSQDEDDYAFLADNELGDAPADTGTYEGIYGKPSGPEEMNKWCARQCERCLNFKPGSVIHLPDFSHRIYNQPWKHRDLSLTTLGPI